MAIILSPPGILPNGTIINGVQWLVQSTKPTTRVDGSALIAGDRWINLNGEEWFWNGTFWLGLELFQGFFSSNFSQAFNLTGATTLRSSASFTSSCFIDSIFIWWAVTVGSANASNYYDLSFKWQDNDGLSSLTIGSAWRLSSNSGSTSIAVQTPINTSGFPITGIYADATTGGSPGTARIVFYPFYRLIAP